MLIGSAELIADIGRDARLDPACADRDQGHANQQTEPRVVKRQRQMTQAIDDRNPENRAVLAPNSVGEDRAQDWQQIYPGEESVIPCLRLGLRHEIEVAVCVPEIFGHEHDQDRVHSVKTEPLGCLVADDERHARRHLVGLQRRGEVFGFGHRSGGTVPDSRRTGQREIRVVINQ